MNENISLEKVRALIEPYVRSQGLVLWGIELVLAQKKCLRIYIDTEHTLSTPQDDAIDPNGAALDQCESVARDVGLALDVENLFPDAWVLEVSTPGLSRVFFSLDQLRAYVGDVVEVHLTPQLGRKFWRGILTSVQDASFTIKPVQISAEDIVEEEESEAMTIAWEDVKRVNRRALFPKPPKPGKTSKKKGSQRA